MEDRALALAEIAGDVLYRLVREVAARKPGGHLVEGRLDRIVLRLALDLDAGDDGVAPFAQRLVAAVDQVIDDAIEHAASFRPGHAFCHRCGVASCEHSQPPSARHVFVGYAPTGAPRWEDFAQWCLELRHPEVDRLFDASPAFVTLVRPAAALNGALVGAFDRGGAYELLGEVAAGFWPVRAREGEGRGIVALTFQIAISRPRHGPPRLGLNVLGRTPRGESLEHLWERHDDIPWRAAVRWAQGALATTGASRAVRREIVGERVDGILRGLARRLERDRRARGRRTRHAESRHLAGDRPTRMAIEDARRAEAASVLYDEKHRTYVVPGERGRTHFFTEDGKLVSSVRYSRDAVDRKRKLGVWAAAPGDAAARLLDLLRARDADDVPTPL